MGRRRACPPPPPRFGSLGTLPRLCSPLQTKMAGVRSKKSRKSHGKIGDFAQSTKQKDYPFLVNDDVQTIVIAVYP